MKQDDSQEEREVSHRSEEVYTAAQQLEVAQMKRTRPRLLVLELLLELKGHYAADEIVVLLQERHTPLPRASVYNTLEALLSKGLVMMADAGPGRALYEAGGTWHHHFVCLACGSVINIPCVKGEKPCLLPERFSGVVEEAQIIFRGYCESCAAKHKKPAQSA
jgi:Fe2+ or Zn2+ uptake regulation protein